MSARSTTRHLEAGAVTAVLPVVALLPVWLLAIAVFWLPTRLFWSLPYWQFALGALLGGVLLFLRPVQRLVLTRLLGARRPTRRKRRSSIGPGVS
ncbi:MAG: hypothetical protein R2705_22140 [Ilumatobacteraceae bacterium]